MSLSSLSYERSGYSGWESCSSSISSQRDADDDVYSSHSSSPASPIESEDDDGPRLTEARRVALIRLTDFQTFLGGDPPAVAAAAGIVEQRRKRPRSRETTTRRRRSLAPLSSPSDDPYDDERCCDPSPQYWEDRGLPSPEAGWEALLGSADVRAFVEGVHGASPLASPRSPGQQPGAFRSSSQVSAAGRAFVGAALRDSQFMSLGETRWERRKNRAIESAKAQAQGHDHHGEESSLPADNDGLLNEQQDGESRRKPMDCEEGALRQSHLMSPGETPWEVRKCRAIESAKADASESITTSSHGKKGSLPDTGIFESENESGERSMERRGSHECEMHNESFVITEGIRMVPTLVKYWKESPRSVSALFSGTESVSQNEMNSGDIEIGVRKDGYSSNNDVSRVLFSDTKSASLLCSMNADNIEIGDDTGKDGYSSNDDRSPNKLIGGDNCSCANSSSWNGSSMDMDEIVADQTSLGLAPLTPGLSMVTMPKKEKIEVEGSSDETSIPNTRPLEASNYVKGHEDVGISPSIPISLSQNQPIEYEFSNTTSRADEKVCHVVEQLSPDSIIDTPSEEASIISAELANTGCKEPALVQQSQQVADNSSVTIIVCCEARSMDNLVPQTDSEYQKLPNAPVTCIEKGVSCVQSSSDSFEDNNTSEETARGFWDGLAHCDHSRHCSCSCSPRLIRKTTLILALTTVTAVVLAMAFMADRSNKADSCLLRIGHCWEESDSNNLKGVDFQGNGWNLTTVSPTAQAAESGVGSIPSEGKERPEQTATTSTASSTVFRDTTPQPKGQPAQTVPTSPSFTVSDEVVGVADANFTATDERDESAWGHDLMVFGTEVQSDDDLVFSGGSAYGTNMSESGEGMENEHSYVAGKNEDGDEIKSEMRKSDDTKERHHKSDDLFHPPKNVTRDGD